jgi:hypothetical protein
VKETFNLFQMTSIIQKKAAWFICTFLLQAITIFSFAQKKGQFTITREQMNQVNQITSPAKAILDEILAKDKTGTYVRYKKDLQALNEAKNAEQRRSITQKILTGYQSFFASVWKEAGIDEKSYQASIRQVFPSYMTEAIQFDYYLGFTMIISTIPPAPPPPPAPDKCLDVCTIAIGSLNGNSYLVSGGGGSYGNCFTRAHAWGAVAAFGEISSELKNNISIPGTFVNDARRLAISLTYDMKIEATAFAVLGASVASASVWNGWTRQSIMVFSPIIFANSRMQQTTIQENFVVDKSAIANFPVNAGSSVMNAVISGSWCNAEASNIRWSVCETK